MKHKFSTSSLAITDPDDDMMVKYGGVVGDRETDEVERAAIGDSNMVAKKGGARSRQFNVGLNFIILSLRSHTDASRTL